MEFKGSFLINTSLGSFACPFIDASDLSTFPTSEQLQNILNSEYVTASILTIRYQNTTHTTNSPIILHDIGLTISGTSGLWRSTPASGSFFNCGSINSLYGIGYTVLLLDYLNIYRFASFSRTDYAELGLFNDFSISFPDANNIGSMIIPPNNISWSYSSDFSGQAQTLVNNYFQSNPPKPYKPTTDPYAEGGTSTTGGGTGNFDLSSDAIDFPGLPTLSAVSTGLISLYTPTITQLNALASYLWNADVTTVDWWKKLVANPLDLILGLSIVPVAAPQGASNNIKVGLIDTGVSMPRCSSQYVEVDCGSLNVSEFWGSALDYAPFRKHSIYLPFIGTRSINTDDIMGKTVSVVYHIDLLSGAATAMIKAGDSVLYQYSGACAISVPLSGQTFTDMITSTIQLAAAIGATVATGGAAAGITAASAANSVMSMKPTIERAGGVSGAAGQLGIMTPYLIGEIPRQSVPENYNQFAGYPSNIKSVLGELSGYTEVETVYLTNIIATSGELGEIESLLKQGVFINES